MTRKIDPLSDKASFSVPLSYSSNIKTWILMDLASGSVRSIVTGQAKSAIRLASITIEHWPEAARAFSMAIKRMGAMNGRSISGALGQDDRQSFGLNRPIYREDGIIVRARLHRSGSDYMAEVISRWDDEPPKG